MLTMRALGTETAEVIIIQQFLLSEMCWELRVEVADPGLAQAGDLLQREDRQPVAREGDDTVGLTGMIENTGSEVDAPPIGLHLRVADLEAINIEAAQDLQEGVESRHLLAQELHGLVVQQLDILSLLFALEEIIFMTEQLGEPPEISSARDRITLTPSLQEVSQTTGCV